MTDRRDRTTLRERLCGVLIGGADVLVDPRDITPATGIYRSDRSLDAPRWEAYGKIIAGKWDGRRVLIQGWDTMTECARNGVSARMDDDCTIQVSARERERGREPVAETNRPPVDCVFVPPGTPDERTITIVIDDHRMRIGATALRALVSVIRNGARSSTYVSDMGVIADGLERMAHAAFDWAEPDAQDPFWCGHGGIQTHGRCPCCDTEIVKSFDYRVSEAVRDLRSPSSNGVPDES